MKVGDLVKIKDEFIGASEETNLLMLVTEIEKGFYQKGRAQSGQLAELMDAHRTDKITMLASNGEIFNEPEQCLEIINEA